MIHPLVKVNAAKHSRADAVCYCMVPCKQRLLWLNMDVNWEWGGNVSVTLVGNTFNFILFYYSVLSHDVLVNVVWGDRKSVV